MSATVLTSVFANGGRTVRYCDFTAVFMHEGAFITTPTEYLRAESWARSCASCGDRARDRAAFVERFDTVLARADSGVASKGDPQQLSQILRAMRANALVLDEWRLPPSAAQDGPYPPEVADARRHVGRSLRVAVNDALTRCVTPLFPK